LLTNTNLNAVEFTDSTLIDSLENAEAQLPVSLRIHFIQVLRVWYELKAFQLVVVDEHQRIVIHES